LLAALHVFSEGFHILRQFVAWLLHGFALVAVFDGVIVNSGFGFLDAGREPGVFRLELLIEREQVVEVL
jgi:hypothetical protein